MSSRSPMNRLGSHGVNKMDYARYLPASLFYLAIHG
jgi:hypothetical protein